MMAVEVVLWGAASEFSAILLYFSLRLKYTKYSTKKNDHYQITGCVTCVINMVARLLTTTYLEVTVSMAYKLFFKTSYERAIFIVKTDVKNNEKLFLPPKSLLY
jgi:hypothetical protein